MQVLSSLANAFKIKELRDRILITLGLLVVFRLGAHIVLPGINPDAVQKFAHHLETTGSRLWGLMMVLSGSALGNLALCSLGIMPYITASIIMSIMAKMDKRLEAIAKEGPAGQKRINQYSRMLAVPVAMIQAFSAVTFLKGQPFPGMEGQYLIPPDTGFTGMAMLVMGLTTGAIFTMWLAEQISEFGLGNGASVLVMAGIVDQMPYIVSSMFDKWKDNLLSGESILLILLLYIGIIVAVVFITQAQRRIPIQHARQWRGQRVAIGQRTYLPIRVNQAGVMPVIFASALMSLPYFLAQIPGLGGIADVWNNQGFIYTMIYIGLIFFFSYFWTYLYTPPTEYANHLKENGSFIPGIRPGENTADYLNKILSRITLAGATFLCLIALIPDKSSQVLGVEQMLTRILGGTGMLIVVGVNLDLIQKIESYLLMQHYGGFLGEGRRALRGRRG